MFDLGFTALIPVELTQQGAVLVIEPRTSRENHAAKLAMMTFCCCGASSRFLFFSPLSSFSLSLSLSLFSCPFSPPPPPPNKGRSSGDPVDRLHAPAAEHFGHRQSGKIR